MSHGDRAKILLQGLTEACREGAAQRADFLARALFYSAQVAELAQLLSTIKDESANSCLVVSTYLFCVQNAPSGDIAGLCSSFLNILCSQPHPPSVRYIFQALGQVAIAGSSDGSTPTDSVACFVLSLLSKVRNAISALHGTGGATIIVRSALLGRTNTEFGAYVGNFDSAVALLVSDLSESGPGSEEFREALSDWQSLQTDPGIIAVVKHFLEGGENDGPK